VALSLANLCYLRTWDAILDSDANITPSAYLVAIANVLLLATLLWGAYVVVRRSGSRWAKRLSPLVPAGLIFIPFHGVGSIYFSEDARRMALVYGAALVAAAVILWSHRARVFGWHALRILAPVVLITFGQAIWRAATYDGTRWEWPTPPPTAATEGRPRLVWIIFDEWDYGLSFDPRPEWLRTPELDRLGSMSFHASQAVPPGSETDVSIPRLLTGDMTARGSQLRDGPTIFSEAKAENLNAAIAAWYIDYCDIFGKSLAACWSTEADPARNSMGLRPTEIAANQVRYLFESTYRSPFGQSVGTKRHIMDYGFVMRGALEAAASPSLDLVFLHFPIPHPPLFYDRTTRRYDLEDTPLVSLARRNPVRYLDAIELVDRTVGQVRQVLESANLWDRTHLIISSDHSARHRERIRAGAPDPRVPFIVRVAGAATEIAYGTPFNTVVSADLAMAMLRGQVHTAAQVRAFIDDRPLAAAGSSASAGGASDATSGGADRVYRSAVRLPQP
jgi:hypothetical protein